MKNGRTLKIGKRTVGEGNPTYIIFEVASTHEGEWGIAREYVSIAKNVGADAVKFQTFKAEDVVTEGGEMASYQKSNLGLVKTQIQMLRDLELPDSFYSQIIQRCEDKKIIFTHYIHQQKMGYTFFCRCDATQSLFISFFNHRKTHRLCIAHTHRRKKYSVGIISDG